MNQAEVDNLMHVTRWAIRDWRQHGEYEDILAEAYASAWEGYQQAVTCGYPNPITWAVKQARWAPINWDRRQRGRKDQSAARFTAQFVGLEAAEELLAPQFEGAVIDRVSRLQLIARIFARSTPQQQRLLGRMYAYQETGFAAAKALGISGATASEQVKRVREGCRDLLEEIR